MYALSSDAPAYCAGLTLNGHTGWRVPTLNELASTVNEALVGPAINRTAFPRDGLLRRTHLVLGARGLEGRRRRLGHQLLRRLHRLERRLGDLEHLPGRLREVRSVARNDSRPIGADLNPGSFSLTGSSGRWGNPAGPNYRTVTVVSLVRGGTSTRRA